MSKKVVKVKFVGGEDDELTDLAVLEGLSRLTPGAKGAGNWLKEVKKRRATDPKVKGKK